MAQKTYEKIYAWYLNRFVDQPHSYIRIMSCACFSYGITGFLHWGFNSWKDSIYGISSDSRFKGDGCIVYPNEENSSLLMSVRALRTREGLEDIELLHMLSEKDSDIALSISQSIAHGFADFNYDPSGRPLDSAREKILSLLDELS